MEINWHSSHKCSQYVLMRCLYISVTPCDAYIYTLKHYLELTTGLAMYAACFLESKLSFCHRRHLYCGYYGKESTTSIIRLFVFRWGEVLILEFMGYGRPVTPALTFNCAKGWLLSVKEGHQKARSFPIKHCINSSHCVTYVIFKP